MGAPGRRGEMMAAGPARTRPPLSQSEQARVDQLIAALAGPGNPRDAELGPTRHVSDKSASGTDGDDGASVLWTRLSGPPRQRRRALHTPTPPSDPKRVAAFIAALAGPEEHADMGKTDRGEHTT